MGFWFGSFFLDLAFAIMFFILMFYLYAKYKFNHWIKNNIEQVEPSFPLGNTTKMILKKENLGFSYKNIYEEFKQRGLSYGGYYFMLKPELMVVNPDVIKQILVTDFQHFVDRGTFYDEDNDPLTAHLFSLNGTKWKKLRSKLTPTFTSGKIKMMLQTVISCADELKNILEEEEHLGKPIDLRDYLSRFTIDVIGRCTFGIECNCLRNPKTDFVKYGQAAFEPQGIFTVIRLVGLLIPQVLKIFKIRAFNKKITDFFIGVVKDTVQYREKHNVVRNDFMHLLLQLKNNGNLENNNFTRDTSTYKETQGETDENGNNASKPLDSLTFEQIAAQCFLFFIAGFETSSNTLTFCFYELAKNPSIQDKLRDEVNTVLEKHGKKLTYEAIMEMYYMDKVINETLRKYPPGSFLTRQCTKDYPLPKSRHVFRKGEMVTISILGLHRDPEYYPDPMKFDPERFSSEEVAKRHPYTFLPFGEGPRICIGIRFGLMQIKVALSRLLKDNSFTINSKTIEPLVINPHNLMLVPLDKIWLNVHKLKS